MKRYHIKVYTKVEHLSRLKDSTAWLNCKNWQYTIHCLDNIKYRVIDLENLLLFIKGVNLEFNNIFEYYLSDNEQDIIKICYRINWQKDLDIILVTNKDKDIITLYLNSKEDLHNTLRKELYINES